MMTCSIKTAFALPLNRASPLNRVSLLCAMAFAVIAEAFRCSAVRFRCYRITAKTAFNALIKNRNISNKMAEKAPEKFSFPVLSLYRPNNSVNGPIRSLAETLDNTRLGDGGWSDYGGALLYP